MFCPDCLCEYRPGFTVCADCHVDLVEELPHEPVPEPITDQELVQILASSDRQNLIGIRDYLAEEGVPALLMEPAEEGPLRLLVRQDDAPEAAQMLKEFLETWSEDGAEDVLEETVSEEEYLRNFAGRSIPDLLLSLLEFQNQIGGQAYSSALQLAVADESVRSRFVLKEESMADFLPIAQAGKSGAWYWLWNRDGKKKLETWAVVLVDGESRTRVCACNLVAMLSLAAADQALTLDPEPRLLEKEESPMIFDFRMYLQSMYGIEASADPLEKVREAGEMLQAEFESWLSDNRV